ncbi:hypothetical protein Zmor_006811 [Zophobas morio]|uniref:lysozyme n=1 Tax=Zophobas morio TaxID=2755281 RepID=A0AA38IVK6_9CUCU|nr:hypothetical protein Zmor_006811 [Zophobas morio]
MNQITTLFVLVVVLLCGSKLEAKIFERCELARALKYNYHIPAHQLATWVCIANYESHFNTGAINTQSGDHGIFQISQIYWCSNSNSPGKGCNSVCSRYRDDDIRDDVACIKKVFAEHQRLFGNGFHAWTTYKYCQSNVNQFIAGCF